MRLHLHALGCALALCLALLSQCGNVVAGSTSASTDSTTMTSTNRLAALNASLPKEHALTFSPATMDNVTLLSVYFANDHAACEQALRQQFDVIVGATATAGASATTGASSTTGAPVTTDQATVEDLLAFRRQQQSLGARVRRFFSRLFGAESELDERVRKEFQAMDLDASNTVDFAEFNRTAFPAFLATVEVPAERERICDAVDDVAKRCTSPTASPKDYSRVQYQLALCRSGFSWMMDGMRVEVCVLRSASTGDRDECGEAITECLEDDDGDQEDERQDDNVVALVKLPTSANSNGNTTNVSPSLAKRGVVAWAATMLLTEAGLTIGLLASLAALAIATTLVVSGKASSTSQVRNYWNEASQFERWTPSIPVPPCGTPILFWNGQCAPLHSNRARNCTRGQLLNEKACGWWWTHGSRTCGFGGCQALCMDIVDENCPPGIVPKKMLTYAPDGFGVPVDRV